MVFREGFETVLFYKAMILQANTVQNGYLILGGGFTLGLLLLGLVYILVTGYGIKMPMNSFLTATSILLYLLAFKFAGDGIAELQEAGYLATTYFWSIPAGSFWTTWFGIRGSLEPCILQGLLLLSVVAGLAYHFWLLPYLATGTYDDEPYEAHKAAKSLGLKIFSPIMVGLSILAVVLIAFGVPV